MLFVFFQLQLNKIGDMRKCKLQLLIALFCIYLGHVSQLNKSIFPSHLIQASFSCVVCAIVDCICSFSCSCNIHRNTEDLEQRQCKTCIQELLTILSAKERNYVLRIMAWNWRTKNCVSSQSLFICCLIFFTMILNFEIPTLRGSTRHLEDWTTITYHLLRYRTITVSTLKTAIFLVDGLNFLVTWWACFMVDR